MRSRDGQSEQVAAVIVAHPDDEILWAGGTMLERRDRRWFVAGVCRGDDPDRAPRFSAVMARLGARGALANLDDGPEQNPLDSRLLEDTIASLLVEDEFELILTHGPRGEYTRHRRHEEVCRAVVSLWSSDRVRAGQLWMFAYQDNGRRRLPQAEVGAHRKVVLMDAIWRQKYDILTGLYGFAPESWEARTTPRVEAFWCFDTPRAAQRWIEEHPPKP